MLLGRKAMANLDSILKSRDITLPTKICLVKAMIFPVAMYGSDSWTMKKAEHQRTDAFELWCWRRLLRVPWTARNPEYSLERLMLKLKLQYFKHLIWQANSLAKILMLGKIEGRRRRGWQRMRWLDGITDSMDMSLSKIRELGDGQGSLACCSPWVRKESDTTKQMNWDFSFPWADKTAQWYSFSVEVASHCPPQVQQANERESESRSVGSNSLQSHESQHARPPCPSPAPRVHWDSHPSSQWCHPAISSSFVPFSSCPQSLPASESFPMTQLLAWGGQSIAVSALASFLPKKSQGWSPSEWTGWISLQSNGLSRVFSNRVP